MDAVWKLSYVHHTSSGSPGSGHTLQIPNPLSDGLLAPSMVFQPPVVSQSLRRGSAKDQGLPRLKAPEGAIEDFQPLQQWHDVAGMHNMYKLHRIHPPQLKRLRLYPSTLPSHTTHEPTTLTTKWLGLKKTTPRLGQVLARCPRRHSSLPGDCPGHCWSLPLHVVSRVWQSSSTRGPAAPVLQLPDRQKSICYGESMHLGQLPS